MVRYRAMVTAVAATAVMLAGGCADGSQPSASASNQASSAAPVQVGGALVPAVAADKASKIQVYDTKLVPQGANARLSLRPADGRTEVTLTVSGLLPDRAYGAHLHVNPCESDPDAAGEHFQNHMDPKAARTPSTNPDYVNAVNEVWLDPRTDASGAATVTVTAPWSLERGYLPRSMVLHAEQTRTGKRVACLTVNY